MKEFLDDASDCYYKGSPFLTDAEFDRLADIYNYNSVGHRVTDRVEHYFPMHSLQKCFDISKAPIEMAKAVESPKLDGAAISILYLDGEYERALTRGDGKAGLDITDKVALLVPPRIKRGGVVQVVGEVLAPKDIPNSRNYAAGALNLKSLQEFFDRKVTFVAYDERPYVLTNWTDTLAYLATDGFQVVTMFDESKYPTDGIVYRINNNAMYEIAGLTSHHPKGSFAFKTQQKGVVTTLLDVIWQVGKSGVVSPVAILDPVKIGDATVAKATLHNIEYIQGLNLEIGCQVEVIRSGEIIPRILRRVEHE
jgi:NAD-dependent DNA ligase